MAVDKIKTDFNVGPYFDDYYADYENNESILASNRDTVENKQYVRILFKPSTAVQARELTQIQTMIQKQISRHGNYFFRDGSVVDGCDVTYFTDLDFIRCKDAITAANTESFPSPSISDISNDYVIASFYEGTEVGTRAVPLFTRPGAEGTYASVNGISYPSTNRIYLRYISEGELTAEDVGGPTSALIGVKEKFFAGETLRIYNENQDKTGPLDTNNLVFEIDVYQPVDSSEREDGVAYAVKVGDGVIYQKGYFLKTLEQLIPVNEYTRNVDGYAVGYNTEESIITFLEDGTLVSNARGFPNENAPGADRFKLSPKLVAKKRDDFTEYKDFFPVVEFSGVQPFQTNKGEEGLRRIRDLMAVRTNEESGDYSVRPFKIEPIPYETAFPQDAAALAVPAIPRKNFAYDISPGTIYCRGYRVDTINNYKLLSRKGLDKRVSNELALSANYGNYLIVQEVLGTFDIDRLSTVDLYDEYRSAISSGNGSDVVPIGNKIGTAKVRAFNYLKGTKGLPDCQYVLYLFDIKMANGNFEEVKSIKSDDTDFGDAIADVYRRPGESVTVLRNPSGKSLVFDTGFKGIDTLKPNDNNENEFIFYDILQSEISSTSKIADFTLNAPYAGGSEIVNGLVNTLEGISTNAFHLSLTEPAETANLDNTIDATSNTTILFTSNTNQLENIKIGDQINIKSGGNEVKRVVLSIDTSSSPTITINEDLVGTAVDSDASAEFSIYYPRGHQINITNVPNAIENIAPNLTTQARQFRVDTDLGGTLDLTQNTDVRASVPVRRTNATETKKEITKNAFVKIDCAGANSVTNELGPWSLGVTDVSRVRNIYVGTNFSEDNPERSAWFEFHNGQKDGFYDYSYLRVRPAYTSNITSATKILVEFDYFTDNKVSGIGFYTVDSYPVNDDQQSNTTIYTEEIPNYYSEIKRKKISLRNSIDFRPKKVNHVSPNADANSAPVILTPNTTQLKWKSDESSTTILIPTGDEEFDVGSQGQYTIYPNTNFSFDLERYLPRIDYLCVNFKGQFQVVEGESNDNPIEPPKPKNLSVIAASYVPPFPSLTPREKQIYGTPETSTITINNRMIKRYTMRDISEIEKRIDRLEYYTTLNLLEQEAKELTVLDENGLDRFKNGIFADGFKSHYLGQIDDIEYNIAIDDRIGVARPKFETSYGDFAFVNIDGSNVVKTRKYIMLPYESVEYISQNFATKFRNSAALSYDYSGTLKLFPDVDVSKDTTREPVKNTVLDFAQPFVDFANGIGGSLYGDWEVVSKNRESELSRVNSKSIEGNISTFAEASDPNLPKTNNQNQLFFGQVQDEISTSVANTEGTIAIDYDIEVRKLRKTTESERTKFDINVGTSSNRQVIGDNVTDVSLTSYMRSREIFFVAYGLKPNTRHYVFFDGIPVSSDSKPCQPISSSQFNSLDVDSSPFDPESVENLSDVIGISSESATTDTTITNESNLIQPIGNLGDAIRTNDSGILAGIFRIPEGQFLNGERKLLVTNVEDLALGKDAQISQATATYNASGISVTKQKQTLTSYEPDLTVDQSIERKTETDIDIVASTKLTDVRADVPVSVEATETPGTPFRREEPGGGDRYDGYGNPVDSGGFGHARGGGDMDPSTEI